jgi:hypothetical protein
MSASSATFIWASGVQPDGCSLGAGAGHPQANQGSQGVPQCDRLNRAAARRAVGCGGRICHNSLNFGKNQQFSKKNLQIFEVSVNLLTEKNMFNKYLRVD